jgi:hypothetical protein
MTEPTPAAPAAAPTIDTLNADPAHLAALHNEDSPGHKHALAVRRQAFEATYGTDPVEPRGASSQPNSIVQHEDGSYGLAPEPTEDEMQQVADRSASLAMQSAGAPAELSDALGPWAVHAGLTSLEVASLAEAIVSGRELTSADEAMKALGSDGAQLVQKAQALVAARRIPQELLDTPLTEHLVVGEHPAVIRALAAAAVRLGL